MKYKTPNIGDTRIRKQFAWRQTDLDDGYTIWLQFYYVREERIEIRGEYGQSIKFWKIKEKISDTKVIKNEKPQ